MIVLALLALALGAVVALRLAAAPPMDGAPILDWPADSFEWSFRSRRVLVGVIVGSALAVGGVALQSLLRNPLAEPSVLGLSAGASLGVMIALYAAYRATGVAAFSSPPILPSLLGALGALAIVLALGQRRGLIDPVSLILVGVVVAVLAGAGVALVQHLLPGQGWSIAARWTLGSLSDDSPAWLVAGVGGATLFGAVLAAWLGPAMDAASLGEDEALSVGVPLRRLRLILFALAGGLTAGSVLLAGPIGFVGLVCPHVVRLLAGPSHRVLVIGAAIAGAILIVGADTLVRVADFGAGRVPIGVLTALVGGPTFLWILRSRDRGTA